MRKWVKYNEYGNSYIMHGKEQGVRQGQEICLRMDVLYIQWVFSHRKPDLLYEVTLYACVLAYSSVKYLKSCPSD
jgi:hypothetical protein